MLRAGRRLPGRPGRPLGLFRLPLSPVRLPLGLFRLPLGLFRLPLGLFRLPLGLGNRQGLARLLGLLTVGGQFVAQLRELLLQLRYFVGARRRPYVAILIRRHLGRSQVEQAVPLFTRLTQIRIGLAEHRQTQQRQARRGRHGR
ncbi:hypothetical protein CCS01_27365 [Rhodopila globiformis]|uniref:Uncharacterized protein n=1 Tax=Rhodopila globiformis TaxID=1071 RepID=A0A2S6MY21_RHOGL|nr:hypothetical protein CCS01_27365 [Rhodopila globiformis]